MSRVAVLHPGAMGSRLGAELVGAGHEVWWVPQGRSAASAQRARAAGLAEREWSDLAAADVVLASCAPQGAVDVASAVGGSGFAGLYVEANPLSPSTLERAAAALPAAHAFVDAAVVGPPPQPGAGTTQLLLAGEPDGLAAAERLWSGTAVLPVRVGERVGQASAAKAAFALYNKGRRALAGLARELAASAGVADALAAQADRPGSEPLGDDELETALDRVAWRWAPEFDELAATAEAYGVDAEPARALAKVWRERAAAAATGPR